MFGTLKLASDNTSMDFAEHGSGEDATRLGNHMFSHSACDSCRVKKLRCSGRRSGCDRCRNKSLDCTYLTAIKGKRPQSRSQQASQNNAPGPNTNAQSTRPSSTGYVWPNQADAGQVSSNAHVSTIGSAATMMQNLERTGSGDHDIGLGDFTQDLDAQGLNCSDEILDSLLRTLRAQPDVPQMRHTSATISRDFPGHDPVGLEDVTSYMPNGLIEAEEMLQEMVGGMPSLPLETLPTPSYHQSYASESPPANKHAVSLLDLSPVVSGKARARTEPNCQCLKSILYILNEIDTNILSVCPTTLHASLSFQRVTVAASTNVQACRHCRGKLEFISLLGIICEKVTGLSEAVVTTFSQTHEQTILAAESRCRSTYNPTTNETVMQPVGSDVDMHKEFKVLSATLITLQLERCVAFVTRTRKTATSIGRNVLANSSKKLEQELKDLSAKVHRLSLDLRSDN